jgi:hypothetical protein
LCPDAEVVVNQPVAHPGHRPPLDFRMLRTELLWNLLRRLADDLQAPHERATERLVGDKRLE